MTGLRTWFATRSLRERRLLVAMAALMVVTIIWAGIVIPVRDGLESSRARYDDAIVRLATTRADVDAVAAARRRPRVTGNLSDEIRQLADQAGFTIGTLDDQGAGRVHVTVEAARPGAMSAWLASLESRGILVDAATLKDTGNRSVTADLILKARAS